MKRFPSLFTLLLLSQAPAFAQTPMGKEPMYEHTRGYILPADKRAKYERDLNFAPDTAALTSKYSCSPKLAARIIALRPKTAYGAGLEYYLFNLPGKQRRELNKVLLKS